MYRTFREFGGMIPVKDGYTSFGYADNAENIDLRSGIIKSVKSPLQIATGYSTTADSLFKFNDQWIADNEYHIDWLRDNINLHIYTDKASSGKLQLQIGALSDVLGLDQPANPTTSTAVGTVSGAYSYVVVWEREMGDYTDVSQPNQTPVTLELASQQTTINRPALPTSAYVVNWKIYRTANLGSNYYLLATVPVGTTTYLDDGTITDDNLIITANLLPSYYTSTRVNELGIDIFWQPPIEDLDGIAGPMNGSLYAWKDDKILISEPGYPQAWPSQYVVSVGAKVKRIIVSELYATVLLENGSARLDFTEPEIALPNRTTGNEGNVNPRAAVLTPIGTMYLADSGIALDNGSTNEIISNDGFDEKWFKENVDNNSASMNFMDDYLYIFHSTKTILIDNSVVKKNKITMLDIIVQGSYQDHVTGDLYVLSNGTVYKLYGSTEITETSTWKWKSGKIISPGGNRIWDPNIDVKGSGTIIGRLFFDGVQVGTDFTFDWSTEFGRYLQCPDGTDGREFQFELEGSLNAEVSNIRFEVAGWQ